MIMEDFLTGAKNVFVSVFNKICIGVAAVFGVAVVYFVIICFIVFLNDVSGNPLGLNFDIWPISLFKSQ